MKYSTAIPLLNICPEYVKVRGVDFLTAVESVMGKAVEIPSFVSPKPKKTYDRVMMPIHTPMLDRAKKYLLARGIDNDIIDECNEQGMITEHARSGAVLFLGFDEKGKLKHCCSRETDGSLGKKDMAGSDKPDNRVLVLQAFQFLFQP